MLDFVYLPSLSFAPWLLKKGDRMMLIKSSLTAFYHLPRHLQRQQVLGTPKLPFNSETRKLFGPC